MGGTANADRQCQAKGEEEGGEGFRLRSQIDLGSSLCSFFSFLVLRPWPSYIFLWASVFSDKVGRIESAWSCSGIKKVAL